MTLDELVTHPRTMGVVRMRGLALVSRHQVYKVTYLLPDGRETAVEGKLSSVLERVSDVYAQDERWQAQLAAAKAARP